MTVDPDLEEMRRLGYQAVDRAVEHLARLGEQRVARRITSAELREVLHEPLPRRSLGVESTIERYFEAVLPRATLVNHPRFFAYIPGPGSFAGAIGAWLAAATNPFVGTWLGGASLAWLEVEVLDWLRQAIGLPGPWDGILTSGGSMANLGALAAARARGGGGIVYGSTEAHYSVAKAARVLGFGAAEVRALPADGAQRLSPAVVAAALAEDRAAGRRPLVVCATAGTTSTGAVDPLAALADLCAEQEVWLHVDAAYGGAAALLPEGRALLAGLERADSITLDPHKWLYCPFECGGLLTRHGDALRRAFTADGAYLQDVPRDEVNFFERGPELSRGARALKLWTLLRSVGVDAIADAIAADMRRCRLARDLLAANPAVEIVTEPRLSVFTFALAGGERAGRELVERLLADGLAMLSSTRVGGRFALRLCVVNHRTTDDDVRRTVARIGELIEGLPREERCNDRS